MQNTNLKSLKGNLQPSSFSNSPNTILSQDDTRDPGEAGRRARWATTILSDELGDEAGRQVRRAVKFKLAQHDTSLKLTWGNPTRRGDELVGSRNSKSPTTILAQNHRRVPYNHAEFQTRTARY